jgi:citrate lyase subunit beta/citryl-CoA lyase
METPMTARSYLFVPGDRNDMLSKAATRGADAIIADLEDAVAPAKKPHARGTVASWLDQAQGELPELWVRINNVPGLLADDIAAMIGPHLTGIMVPKVRTVAELDEVSSLIDSQEVAAGMPAGSVRLMPIVETAAGLLAVAGLATATRVTRLMIGEFDLAADLGIDATDDPVMLPMRLAVVVASAAAGIEPPLGPVSADFRNLDALRAHTEDLSHRGFGARPAIHPAQVPAINEVFTPGPDDLAHARLVVDRYDAALASGSGATTDVDGTMLDEAVVRAARRTLERGGRYGTTP